MEDFKHFKRVVPDIPEQLIDSCTKSSTSTREEIITNSRATSLILQMKKEILPNDLVPIPDDTLTTVTPQQIQFISVLVDFLHQNPQILVKCLKDRFQNPDNSKFTFLVSSAIPSIYGFFSSSEHISLSFSFYCLIIGTCTHDLAAQAVTPFFTSACTYKFIESVFNKFCTKFCDDARLSGKSIPQKVIDEYCPLAIDAIIESYSLLPQQHQFLLKFMKTRGWKMPMIIRFLLHKFAFPQLLRLLKSTPFKSHFLQLREFAKALVNKTKEAERLFVIFDKFSIYEIPPAFTVFDIPFIQILMSTQDVHSLVQSLMSINELPSSIHPFVHGFYFQKVDNRPFWLKIYSRKPRPKDGSYNWRKVVFEEKILKSKENIEVEKGSPLPRIWNQLVSEAVSLGQHPLFFFTEEPKTPKEKEKSQLINRVLSTNRETFLNYAVDRSLQRLEEQALSFEDYLVHSLAFHNLSRWLGTVNDALKMIIVPFAETSINDLLKDISPKDIVGNQRYIDNILDVATSKIDMPLIRQLQCLTLIEYILPTIITPKMSKTMRALESRWEEHIEAVRTSIVLPPEFSNRNKKQNKALLLNKKLWEITSYLGSIRSMKFSKVFFVFLSVLNQIKEFEFIDNNTDPIIQFCIAFADCPVLLTRFIVTNSLLVKQDRFKNMSDTDNDLMLWCRLESSILKLLALDSALMNDCLIFQQQLMDGKYV